MSCRISRITVERYCSSFGIQNNRPRLSWRFEGDARDWDQGSYDIVIKRGTEIEEYNVQSGQSTFVSWPSAPLRSREKLKVSIRSHDIAGRQTPWKDIDIEAALMHPAEWSAQVTIAKRQAVDAPKRPIYLRQSVELESIENSRLYVSALGLYEVYLNGQRVGDHVLAPGWQSYQHRLHYQIFDVSTLLVPGRNQITAVVAEGWYAGRLGWEGGRRDIYGDDIGLILQLEVGGKAVVVTGGEGWEWCYGLIISSELYDGEVVDYSQVSSEWQPAQSIPRPKVSLVAAECPPVRRQEILNAVELITTPSGRTILDFGQNLVGWVRFVDNPPCGKVIIRHAEVLEAGELGTRPLRVCKAADTVVRGKAGWEPSFTFHGFRYAEIRGWENVSLTSIVAVVIHSDMERIGDFECSHSGLTRFHQNTLWSAKGNFVSIPTDCPQRDERLGWTGDLQVFTPTASFLFDCAGLLGHWLDDLRLEQEANEGVPPLVIPNTLKHSKAFAIWGDVTALTPNYLFEAFGDEKVLRDQWDSMVAWLERGVRRQHDGLWDPSVLQLGDWLDPTAPDDRPDDTHSDSILVANAFLIYTTRIVGQIALTLGREADCKHYLGQAEALTRSFQNQYVTPNGMVMSDTQATLALILRFGLTSAPEKTAARLDWHIRRRGYKICTGFAGTPVLLPALVDHGLLNTAYRMFQEKQCPSLLYPISKGATTIWERWNSMMPDGSVNPGEMTSFNHYALGQVSSFLYETVGGISPLSPGWKRILIKPQPGGSVKWAKVSHTSPYGRISCRWEIFPGDILRVKVEVPPNSSARVVLPGVEEEVGSGSREWSIKWIQDPAWPPKVLQPPPMRPQMIDEVVL